MEIYKLKPLNQKSFYGKATVIKDGGSIYLKSYDTVVASKDIYGNIHRYWAGWTQTTGKHIATMFGLNKKEWEKITVEPLPKITKDAFKEGGIYVA